MTAMTGTTQDGTGSAVDRSWMDEGACRGGDPDALFVRGAEQNVAKQVCRTCPVRTECLADALDSRTEFGVWGGMTERERRALLRRRPEVRSWTQLLLAAREEHLAGSGVPAPRASTARVAV